MLHKIMNQCRERYHARRQEGCDGSCTYEEHCMGYCGDCLHYIHTPSNAPKGAPPRKYDCLNMADFYTCKYSYRYTSELIDLFGRLDALKDKKRIHVLSFGSGPCTDVLALEYLKKNKIYNFNKLRYLGIDYSEHVWSNVHGDIIQYAPEGFNIEFIYADACDIMRQLNDLDFLPDLIVMQYFLSDMNKNCDAKKFAAFRNELFEYVNQNMNHGGVLAINDINLSTKIGGAREYLREFPQKIHNCTNWIGHYDIEGKKATPVGARLGDNRLYFEIDSKFRYFSPMKTCGSAQGIVTLT